MRFPILAAAVFSLFLAQSDESLRIDSPPANGTVFGMVEIRGSASATGMTRYSLDFAYEQNPTGTWFPIADGATPVQHAALAEWDTTLVSEGNYSLKLTAYLQDGSVRAAVVDGIHVGRYSAAAPSPSGERLIPFQPDSQTSGRAAAFPAPTAAFASGPPLAVSALPYRETAFLSGAGLAVLAFGFFLSRSLIRSMMHKRFVVQTRKNESSHG
jgi:hypothetical protein